MRKKIPGFTLLELLIVIAIIGILAAIGIVNYSTMTRKSGEALTKGNLGTIRSALSIYYGDNEGIYPYDNLNSLASNTRYLRVLPFTRTQPHHLDTTLVTAETTVTDTAGWTYDNDSNTPAWGNIHVGCLHQDINGRIWSSF